MRVYLIRHGQTLDNASGTHQGWNSVSLSEKGVRQAEGARDIMKDIRIDRIYCSDLNRTKETCSIIFPDRTDVIYDERLREINNSVLTGIKYDTMAELYGPEHRHRMQQYNFSLYGGESRIHFKDRVQSFMNMLRDLTDVERVAVVTHGGVIHAVESIIYDIPPSSEKSSIENASISVVKLDPHENWKIVTWGYFGKIR